MRSRDDATTQNTGKKTALIEMIKIIDTAAYRDAAIHTREAKRNPL